MGQMSRRHLLFTGAAVGGGFLLGLHLEALPRVLAATAEGTQNDFAPNAFIRIGKDGRITLIMNQVEMGQGTYTSMPMLIAEELEVGLDQVHLEHAPPNDKLYANPLFGDQETGASSSVKAFYEPLRRARAHHAGGCCRRDLERGHGVVSGAQRSRHPHADRPQPVVRRSGRKSRDAAGAGASYLEGPEGFQTDQHACQATRYAGEGERRSGVRHRRATGRN